MNKKLFYILPLMFLLVLTMVSATATAPDSDDVVAYWALEDLTDETDTYTLTDYNTPTSGATGILDDAYSFDGVDDYLNPSGFDPSSDIGSGDFSVSAWVKGVGTQNDYDRLFQLGINSASSTDVITIYVANDKIGLYSKVGSTGGNLVDSTTDLSTTNFQHIVLTRSGTTIKVYIDNSLEIDSTDSDNGVSNFDKFYIGSARTSEYFFGGVIDEVSVYDVALSSDEVEFLYNGGSPTTAQQYPFSSDEVLTTNITSIYLNPNGTVYGDETTLKGVVTLNQTSGIYLNYTYYVNDVSVATGQDTTPTISNDIPVLSNTYFTHRDEVKITALAVNSSNTSQRLSLPKTSNVLTISNYAPTVTASLSPLTALNETDINAYCTISDADGDSMNISWAIYNDTGVYDSGNPTYVRQYPFPNTLNSPSDSGTMAFYDFQTVNDLTSNNNDLTEFGDASVGVSLPSFAVLDGYASFGGIAGYYTVSDSVSLSPTTALTLSVWFNYDTLDAVTPIVMKGNTYTYGLTIESGLLNFYLDDGSLKQGHIAGSYADNIYYHAVLTYDDATDITKLYLDGVEKTIVWDTAQPTGSITNDANSLYIGSDNAGTGFWDGSIDELSIYDYALDQEEITFLYDYSYSFINKVSGTYNVGSISNLNTEIGNNYSVQCNVTDGYLTGTDTSSVVTITDILNFTVSAVNEWTGLSINDFSILLNGIIYNTTDGTLITPVISNETFDVIVYSDDYFNRTYTDWNLSGNLEANLYQSEIGFTTSEYLTGDLLSSVTYVVDGMTNTTFHLSTGEHTVTASKTGYYDLEYTFTVTPLQSEIINIEGMYDSVITVNAKHIVNNDTINNFTGYAYNTEYSFNESFSTTNGTVYVPAIQGTNISIKIINDDYATSTEDAIISIIPDASTETINFYLYKTNSLIINFYDAINNSLIDDRNISFELISNLYSANLTTINGSFYLTLLQPETYTTRSTADNYTINFYYFTLIDDTYELLNIYLTPDTNTYLLPVKIIDQNSRELEGAVVNLLRYDITSNSYNSVGRRTTTSQGLTYFYATLGDEFYKFIISYNDLVVKTTTAQIIETNDQITIQVDTTGSSDSEFTKYFGTDARLSFNNLTNNFKAEYTNTFGLGDTVCLKLYRVKATGTTLYDSGCSSSSSGSILLMTNHLMGSVWRADLYIDSVLVDSLTHEYVDDSLADTGVLFIQIILLMMSIAIGFYNASTGLMSAGASIIVGKLMGFNLLGWYSVIGLFIILIIVGLLIREGGA